MRTLKILSISLSLAAFLFSCNLPAELTFQATSPTGTVLPSLSQSNTLPAVIPPPTSTPIPPNTPVWLAYNYTCEFTPGGADMTMNLAWTDHSNDEGGFRVYRDGEIITTLSPDSTHYLDVAFVAAGKALSYSVEAFNEDWSASSSTITYGCQ